MACDLYKYIDWILTLPISNIHPVVTKQNLIRKRERNSSSSTPIFIDIYPEKCAKIFIVELIKYSRFVPPRLSYGFIESSFFTFIPFGLSYHYLSLPVLMLPPHIVSSWVDGWWMNAGKVAKVRGLRVEERARHRLAQGHQDRGSGKAILHSGAC